MARQRPAGRATEWVVRCDRSSILLWVDVDQELGTFGQAKMDTHRYREDATEVVLARYNGEDKANDFHSMLRVLRTILDTAERAWMLQQEREDL